MSQLTVQQALSILQLQPGATQKQIRAAYKRLALKLHPDKHQRQLKQHKLQQQQHDAGSLALPADPAAAFSLLSAAYELLSGSHHQPASSSSSSSTWPSFEAAYGSGSLFSDALLDQAVLSGLAPADVAVLQQLCSAASSRQLAQQLAQQPPSQAEEQQWRQLYRRLTVNWQLEQLKQQQLQQQQVQQQQGPAAAGVGLVELLSDLLLRPTGQLMVEVSDDEEEEQQQQQLSCLHGRQPSALSRGSSTAVAVTADCRSHCSSQQQRLQGAGSGPEDVAAAASGTGSTQQAQQQQAAQHHRQPSACTEHTQQHSELHQQQQQQQLEGRAKRTRHGLGFYWMWLRRLLLARALLSVLTSKHRPSYDADLLAVL